MPCQALLTHDNHDSIHWQLKWKGASWTMISFLRWSEWNVLISGSLQLNISMFHIPGSSSVLADGWMHHASNKY